MTITHNSVNIKWRNGRVKDIQNTLSNPVAERNFLSLGQNLPCLFLTSLIQEIPCLEDGIAA